MRDFKHNLNFSSEDKDLKGFQEVIFSVSNLEREISFYQRVCGWELVYRNSGGRALKQLWSLDTTVEIEEALLQNPGDKEGFLRLVKFRNVTQQQIRSATGVWDTGGIFDINIRTHNMDTMYRELQDEGWNGYTDPHRYIFDIYDVSEVLMKGPDGVTIAIMQRFSPPLEGFEHMKKTSRIFNSSVIVRDMKATYNFFINILGFTISFQTPGTNRKTGNNVLGIPNNINQDISVPIDIVKPDMDTTGSIEYLQTKELKGKDCSSLAKPPNLGILMYRFPVRDADAYAKKLIEKGVNLNAEVQTLEIQPYGNLKVFSVVSPDGVWIEFIELIN